MILLTLWQALLYPGPDDLERFPPLLRHAIRTDVQPRRQEIHQRQPAEASLTAPHSGARCMFDPVERIRPPPDRLQDLPLRHLLAPTDDPAVSGAR